MSMILAWGSSLPWWAVSLISNVCIIFTEYMNRASPGGWREALPYTFLPIVVAQACLYGAFSGAPHWLTAWAVFSLGNSVMRVGGVWLMAESEISSWTHVLLGIMVITGGSFLIKQGLR